MRDLVNMLDIILKMLSILVPGTSCISIQYTCFNLDHGNNGWATCQQRSSLFQLKTASSVPQHGFHVCAIPLSPKLLKENYCSKDYWVGWTG